VLRDPATQETLATLPAQTFAWSADNRLVIFDDEVATARITIDAQGQVTQTELLKAAQWHGEGSPAKMTGQIVSADGSMAWEVFELGATLVELDLNKKTFDELHSIRGYLHALDVRESLNLLATGGDDGFVRVRKLSDFALVKEFKVEPGVPQGVTLLEDGRHVVFSASGEESPTRISVGDLSSGERRTLFDVPQPFVSVHAVAGGFMYNRDNKVVLARWTDGTTVREFPIEGELNGFAVSANGEWLVTANKTGSLFLFDVRKGTRAPVGAETIDNLTGLTISSDGRYVYTTEFRAKLRQWDTQTSVTREIGSIRGQARNLRLSRDEKQIVIGGNHRDVAIYKIPTGELQLYFEIGAADFYVTNVWLSGNRLLFSTDAGVLFDGQVKHLQHPSV
jgi:WD40 repeat protein